MGDISLAQEIFKDIDLGRGRSLDYRWTRYNVEVWPSIRFRIRYDEPDTYTGSIETQFGRWWYIEPDMDEEAIVRTVWLALQVSDEHVRREWFTYKGVSIFNPHNRILNETQNEVQTEVWRMH